MEVPIYCSSFQCLPILTYPTVSLNARWVSADFVLFVILEILYYEPIKKFELFEVADVQDKTLVDILTLQCVTRMRKR